MDGSLRILDVQSNRLVSLSPEETGGGGGGGGRLLPPAPTSDLLSLSCLSGLEELYLSHNGVERVQGLERLTSLHTLDLSNNKIPVLEGISHLHALEECWMNDNRVSDFECVAAQLKPLPRLKTVYLERNPVSKEFGYRKRLADMLPTLTQIDASRIPGRR